MIHLKGFHASLQENGQNADLFWRANPKGRGSDILIVLTVLLSVATLLDIGSVRYFFLSQIHFIISSFFHIGDLILHTEYHLINISVLSSSWMVTKALQAKLA